MIALCTLDEIADGASKRFQIDNLNFFIVRQAQNVFGYINSCPHLGIPLEWNPDDFLCMEGSHIQCCTHGALFEIENGLCIFGPCRGDALQSVPILVDNNTIYLAIESA